MSAQALQVMRHTRTTPGPWHVDRDEYPEATILDVAHHNFDGKTRRVVADVFNGSRPRSDDNRADFSHPTDEDKANAKLIAAAPELLNALIHLLQAGDEESIECATYDAHKAIEKAGA